MLAGILRKIQQALGNGLMGSVIKQAVAVAVKFKIAECTLG